jgi:hypothetical protein
MIKRKDMNVMNYLLTDLILLALMFKEELMDKESMSGQMETSTKEVGKMD